MSGKDPKIDSSNNSEFDILFHFNPRLEEKVIVRNSYFYGQWGDEEKSGGCPIKHKFNCLLKIICEEKGYFVKINDDDFIFFRHRLPPENVTHFFIDGFVNLYRVIYKSPTVSEFHIFKKIEKARNEMKTM